MLSDHGFERLEESVNVNVYLREQGFLKMKKQSPRSLSAIPEEPSVFDILKILATDYADDAD